MPPPQARGIERIDATRAIHIGEHIAVWRSDAEQWQHAIYVGPMAIGQPGGLEDAVATVYGGARIGVRLVPLRQFLASDRRIVRVEYAFDSEEQLLAAAGAAVRSARQGIAVSHSGGFAHGCRSGNSSWFPYDLPPPNAKNNTQW